MISNPDLNPDDFDFAMVVEMRKTAAAKPMDPVAGVLSDQDKITKTFEYGGYPIRVKLTLDKLVDRWAWHISLTRNNGPDAEPTALPDTVVDSIVAKFLPDDRMEIPSVLYPGAVRQFIQLCDKRPTP